MGTEVRGPVLGTAGPRVGLTQTVWLTGEGLSAWAPTLGVATTSSEARGRAGRGGEQG